MANEKRLIDANEAVKLLRGKCVAKYPSTFLMGILASASEVEQLPTVDAVKVVHGRWEKAEYHGFLRCSECMDVYIDDTWVADGKWNYCPNCGAKMDGERREGE